MAGLREHFSMHETMDVLASSGLEEILALEDDIVVFKEKPIFAVLSSKFFLSKICWHCFAQLKDLKKKLCSACKLAKYCSQGCHRRDWFQHKQECELLQRAASNKELLKEIQERYDLRAVVRFVSKYLEYKIRQRPLGYEKDEIIGWPEELQRGQNLYDLIETPLNIEHKTRRMKNFITDSYKVFHVR